MKAKDTKEKESVLNVADVLAMLPVEVTQAKLVRWARSGLFPSATNVTPKLLVWRRSEVEAWILERWPSENKYTRRSPEPRHSKKAESRGRSKA